MIVSIVTLNYKKKELTIACMQSLYQEFKEEFERGLLELIIVDNASDDGSVEELRKEIHTKKYKNVTLIPNKTNSGFGSGCNIGAAVARGENLLFLNNDTIINDKNILKMAEYLDKRHDIAILGGQLRNMDGSRQSSAGRFYTLGNAILLLFASRFIGESENDPKTISPVDWVKGALFMIRKKVFHKLHGFDERIFMYGEDMELCYRANELGYKVYFYPEINITHIEHGSANRSFAIINIYKNLLYFYKKHRSSSEYHLLKFLLQIKAIVLIIVGGLVNNKYLVDTYKKALSEI